MDLILDINERFSVNVTSLTLRNYEFFKEVCGIKKIFRMANKVDQLSLGYILQ